MNFLTQKEKGQQSHGIIPPRVKNRKIKSRRRLPNVCSLPLAVVLLDDDKQGVVEHSNLISELPGRGEGPPEENFGGARLPRYPLAPCLPPRSFPPWLVLERCDFLALGPLVLLILTLRAPPWLLVWCLFSRGEELSIFLRGDKCVSPIFLRNLSDFRSICCSSLGSHMCKTLICANSADPFCSLR